MRTVLFALLALACGAGTQFYYRPSDKWPQQSPAPRWYGMTPGDSYLPAWEYVKTCANLNPDSTGGHYKDVKWMTVAGGLYNEKGERILGVWLYPDTIVLDSAWIEAPWLVAHELLHHLRHIRHPIDGNPHPDYPFKHPCMLTYYQNVPIARVGRPVLWPWGIRK